MPKNKANLMFGIINRGVSYKSSELIWNIYHKDDTYCVILGTNKYKRCRNDRVGTEKSN